MKVFVWKAHGGITVYAIETVEQRLKLKHALVECLQAEGEDSANNDLKLSEIISLIHDQYNSDMFEYGTGVVRVEE